ncbi:hypothetical protein FRC02_002468 [Tulasnella sp. 418]|nr:hypothetical protein FRC02_002468 [Tulasnella sp. 418]
MNSLKDPNLLPDGQEIGIYCTDKYDIGIEETAAAVMKHLRGIDMWVYKALEHLANEEISNITYTINFVVYPDNEVEIVIPARDSSLATSMRGITNRPKMY